MDIIILRNVQPEDEKNLALALEKAFAEYADNVIVKIDEIRKQKKAEYDKQRYLDKKNFTMKNSEKSEKSEILQEERENEKEEEKEKRSKKEKEEERVKEKEELFNIYAPEPEKAKTEKPVKHKYGNFQHVFLTDDDYQRLAADFADLPERIQRLDDYLENTGKVYKNHALTIRSWANKDAKQMQQMPNQVPKEKTFRDLRIEMERQEQDAEQAKQDYFVDSFWRV